MSEHRTFESWASRDVAIGKMQVSKYSHPLNDYSFNAYMLSKQTIGGKFREWNNWQKWIPREALMESLCRHIEELKLLTHWYWVIEVKNKQGVTTLIKQDILMDELELNAIEWQEYYEKTIEETLNAIRFNSEALKLSYLEEQYWKWQHL